MKTAIRPLLPGMRRLCLAALVSLVPAAFGAQPVITSVASTLGVVNNAFTYQVEASGTPTSYAATGLPAGLNINPDTGLISGTSSAGGVFAVELSATNADGTDTAPLALTIGRISTFYSGNLTLGGATGLVFDANGDLIVSQSAGAISKINPSGLLTPFTHTGAGPAQGIALDSSGNLYLSLLGGTIAKVTPAGSISTFATGFNNPRGLAFDAAGNLYVANFLDRTIKKITPTGVVSTFQTLTVFPSALAFDSTGNLFVSTSNSSGGNFILKLSPAGVGSLFASGIGGPLAFDQAGTLYVAGGDRIHKLTPTGAMGTLATGYDFGSAALAIDASGSLYVSNTSTVAITRIGLLAAPVISSDPKTRALINEAFSFQIEISDAPATFAAVGLPTGLSVDTATGTISGTPTQSGAFSVSLSATNSVGTGTSTLTILVGTLETIVTSVLVNSPTDMTIDPAGNIVTVQFNGQVARVTPAGEVSVLVSGLDGALAVAYDANGNLYVSRRNGYIHKITFAPSLVISVFATGLSEPRGLAFDSAGNLYVAQALPPPTPGGLLGLISKITPAGVVSTFASGPDFPNPLTDLEFDREGNLYVLSQAQIGNSSMIKIAPDGSRTVFAEPFSFPTHLAVDCDGALYVLDFITGVRIGRISRVTTTGSIGDFAINSSLSLSQQPEALAVDRSGELYVATTSGINRIRFPNTTPVITSPTTATGTVGKPFNYTITATNCPTEFAAEGLPCGLVLNATTGVITGTPKQAGCFSVDLAAANDDGTGFAVLHLKIAPPPDCTPPVISKLKATPCVLWPANHKLVSVTVSAKVTDNVGVTSFKIIKVTSSEADSGLGHDDVARDIQITGKLTVNLRAERSGKGNGRTYTITVEARDAAGNKTVKTVTVFVPKNQGR